VRSELTSLPASGSLTQKAPSWTLSGVPKHCGTHSAACSAVPLATMPDTASVLPKIASVMPASPQHISSLTMGQVRPVGSAKAFATKSAE
jgi:hypothetical protein